LHDAVQRLLEGDNVTALLNVQVLHDTPTISEDENPEQ